MNTTNIKLNEDMTTHDHKQLFIISGPSGAGEDSIINGLAKRLTIKKAVTTTTRKPRAGEVHGKDYYYISKEEFERMLDQDLFAEWAQHYNGCYYGTTRSELLDIQEGDAIGVWKIDYKGVEHAKKIFPDIIAIFLMADSLKVLEKRIRARGDITEEYVTERMAYTREWLNHTDLYDYTVINKQGYLNNTLDDIEHLLRHHSGLEELPHHTSVSDV